MEYKDINFTIDNRIATITINRKKSLNSIRKHTYDELIHAFQYADSSENCHLIKLTGAGNNFSAGNDLNDLCGDDHTELMDYVSSIFKTVSSLHKVLIAQVDGVAVGIGSTILLHCDFVFCTDRARFKLPFTQLGVGPEGAASALLPKIIGHRKAAELLLTGRFFSAEEALRFGLVNQVLGNDEIHTAVNSYTEQLLNLPLEGLMATKSLLKDSVTDVASVVDKELQVFEKLLGSEETQSRIHSLLKK